MTQQASAFRTVHTGFLLSEERRVNWRNVEKTDISRILQGDLRDLNGCLEELAYTELEKDPYLSTSADAHKLMKVMQFGLQYLLFTQSVLKHNLTKASEAVKTEKVHLERLGKVSQHQKRKLKKLESELDRLDQRAHHYDMMSDFLRPHLDRHPDFKALIEPRPAKGPTPRPPEPEYRPSGSQDWMESADFELSGSYAGERGSVQPPSKPISVVSEEQQARLSRFNSPGTGLEGMYGVEEDPEEGQLLG